jgi:hypothetical protein
MQAAQQSSRYDHDQVFGGPETEHENGVRTQPAHRPFACSNASLWEAFPGRLSRKSVTTPSRL